MLKRFNKKVIGGLLLLCALYVSIAAWGGDKSMKNWRSRLQNEDVQHRHEFIMQLLNDIRKNNGQADFMNSDEFDKMLEYCAGQLKTFPWEEYAKKPSEAIRNLAKDDPMKVAAAQLLLLAYANELGVRQGMKFAKDMENAAAVTPSLKTYWQNAGSLVKPETERWQEERKLKNYQPSKEAFVQMVVNKTYLNSGAFNACLANADVVAEIRGDKEAMALVLRSFTEDFPYGNQYFKGDDFQKQRFIEDRITRAVWRLLKPLEKEYYDWLVENVKKPGILEQTKKKMEVQVEFYGEYLKGRGNHGENE